jgi:S1-C subfamily serine protease
MEEKINGVFEEENTETTLNEEIAEAPVLEEEQTEITEVTDELSEEKDAFGFENDGPTSVCTIEDQPPKKKKKINAGLLTVGIMLGLICVATIAFAIGLAIDNNTGSLKMPPVYTPDYQYTSSVTEDNAVLLDNAGVVKKVISSTVLITVQKAMGTGMGSGFVFTENGLIITNAHVVKDSLNIKVSLYDGSTYPAEIVGMDTSSDVAVLRINATGLTPVDIGDSSKVVIGEDVVAIGNPYDMTLAFTSTYGGISAIRDGYHFTELGILLDVFQHDAAINSGNSGGPLFNMYGQVIGINAIRISGYENIGFAIQINSVLDVIEDIVNTGSVQRPTLGISCKTESNIGGVFVATVNEGSAAEKAGIQPGDIITKINSQRVKSTEELLSALGKYEPGEKCTVTVLRDAESIVLDVVLDEAY